MNKQQKEIQQQYLNNEKLVLKDLKTTYQDALDEINGKIAQLLGRQDADMQYVIYQVDYQKALKSQVQGILDQLNANQFETISSYLSKSYEDGFLGTMYDLQNQGIPLVIPIDQEQVTSAIQHKTKLSEGLYTALGKDIKELQKKISGEISRGISTGQMYSEIARNIASYAGISRGRAMTIARTEGHRIQCQATSDAQWKAKDKGADIVKQWDAALDGKTRDTHRKLDGQIRELDEPFEVDGMEADMPGGFGRPEEDINCRCALLQRARWALDEDFTKAVEYEDGTVLETIKAKDYQEFKENYFNTIDEQRVRSSLQMINKMAQSESSKNDWSKTTARSVSKEEKQQIFEYAERKGIHIHDISKFDGDPDILKSEIDTLSNLSKEYPGLGKKITVSVSNKLPDDDFAVTTNSTIMFNTKALRNRDITRLNIIKGSEFASKNVEDIAVHEFGHIIASVKGNKGIEITQQAYYNVYNKRMNIDETLEFLYSNVSRYSVAYPRNGSENTFTFDTKKYHEVIPEVLAKNNSNADEFTREFARILKEGVSQ